MIEEKINLIHEYARHTLYKCNTGYSLDGDQDESKFLKKRVESMRIFILKKLKCPLWTYTLERINLKLFILYLKLPNHITASSSGQ